MDIRDNLLYTKEHEWLAVDDNVATVGITDYAQGELGDIVFIELPEIGTAVTQMEPFGTIEAVKAVNDLFAPVSGKVMEVNSSLVDEPDQVNASPYEDGWMVKILISNKSELDELLTAAQYRDFIGG